MNAHMTNTGAVHISLDVDIIEQLMAEEAAKLGLSLKEYGLDSSSSEDESIDTLLPINKRK